MLGDIGRANNGTFIAHSLHVFYPFFKAMYMLSHSRMVWYVHIITATLTYVKEHASREQQKKKQKARKKIKARNCDFLDEKHFF